MLYDRQSEQTDYARRATLINTNALLSFASVLDWSKQRVTI
jgi:hypothetical protein